jgi:hypothetical protein
MVLATPMALFFAYFDEVKETDTILTLLIFAIFVYGLVQLRNYLDTPNFMTDRLSTTELGVSFVYSIMEFLAGVNSDLKTGNIILQLLLKISHCSQGWSCFSASFTLQQITTGRLYFLWKDAEPDPRVLSSRSGPTSHRYVFLHDRTSLFVSTPSVVEIGRIYE